MHSLKTHFILVRGSASGKEFKLAAAAEDMDADLLSFLRANGLPVASSCSGRGRCEKCVFNSDKLACVEKVRDYLGKEVVIDYF